VEDPLLVSEISVVVELAVDVSPKKTFPVGGVIEMDVTSLPLIRLTAAGEETVATEVLETDGKVYAPRVVWPSLDDIVKTIVGGAV